MAYLNLNLFVWNILFFIHYHYISDLISNQIKFLNYYLMIYTTKKKLLKETS